MVKVYDLDGSSETRLANISTRGRVQTDENVLIAGTIVLGHSSQRVLIRALGPSLDIPGKLLNPTLDLVDGNGTLIAANDNWRSAQETEIAATTIPPRSDEEAAIVATLAPALYTAIVRGVGDGTGVALVEIYALEPIVSPSTATRRAKASHSQEPAIGLLPQEPSRQRPLRSKATL